MLKFLNWLKALYSKKQDAPVVAAPVATVQPPVPPKVEAAPYSVKPWRDWFVSRIGWTEYNHDKELSLGWPLVGLPQYKTVIGNSHAWCGMAVATALNANGYKFPHGAAGAANWDGYGQKIDWKKDGIPQGAIVRIRHFTGGAHVTTANRDHKAGETILEGLGGNQSDSIKVSIFNVTGNAHDHDQIMWVGWPVKA